MINELLKILFIDITHLIFYKLKTIKKYTITDFKNYTITDFKKYLSTTSKLRWFYIHSITNFIISYYSLNDIYDCITNMNICYKIPWNISSYKIFYLSFILHIYHCLFFELSQADYLHHFLMVFICGPLCYTQKTIISSFALFFLTGLPGAIDYLLLYLVKLNMIKSITEKKIYTYISFFIRSPGCILTSGIGLPGLIEYNKTNDIFNFITTLSLVSLTYWNGQYYLMKSHESYLRNKP